MRKEDINNAPKYAGVYMFRNKLNGKCYIGQAIKLKKQLQHHINNYEHDRYDAPIYRAFKKYGLENFELKILISWHDALGHQTKRYLDMYEKRYIEQYNSMAPNGYNQTLRGDESIDGYKFTKEQLKRKSENSKKIQNDGRNLVYCYNIIENKVTTATSISDLGKILNTKMHSGALRNHTFRDKYILARDKETLQKKIANFKSGKLSKRGKYTFKQDVDKNLLTLENYYKYIWNLAENNALPSIQKLANALKVSKSTLDKRNKQIRSKGLKTPWHK